MDSRRRSQLVALTLVGLPAGAIALANAPGEQQMRRNLYTDRGACERDYNREQCEPNTTSSSTSSGGRTGSSTTSGYLWHGPYYNADRTAAQARSDPGPGRTGQVHPTQASVRGGFGSIGRAMRAIG